MASDVRIGGTVQQGRGESGSELGSDEDRRPRPQARSTGLTSTSRTAGCGPACPVVWEGRAVTAPPIPIRPASVSTPATARWPAPAVAVSLAPARLRAARCRADSAACSGESTCCAQLIHVRGLVQATSQAALRGENCPPPRSPAPALRPGSRGLPAPLPYPPATRSPA